MPNQTVEWGPYKIRWLVSKFTYAKMDRNGPSSANFYGEAQIRPYCLYLLVGKPTYLSLSHPLCLSPKDSVRSDIMKLKEYESHWAGKG